MPRTDAGPASAASARPPQCAQSSAWLSHAGQRAPVDGTLRDWT